MYHRKRRALKILTSAVAAVGDYEKPLKISDIFREGLRSEIDPRSQLREMECFVSCHRDLQNDGVIASWRYERQDGPWSEWTIVVRPVIPVARKLWHEILVAMPAVIARLDHHMRVRLGERLPAGELSSYCSLQ